jgi:DNA-binding response OmpR family regulator
MTHNHLKGRRVLIVEDEGLIALDIADALTDAGVDVIGPITSLDKALVIASEVPADVALLDVSLARQPVWPAAEVLARRGIPIIFLTGFAGLDFPFSLATYSRLSKPVARDILLSRLSEVLTAFPDRSR